MEIEKIINYTIEEEEVLVDMIRYLMEDMRSNVQHFDEVQYIVGNIKKVIRSAKY